jgi:hypothetical protein
MTSAPEECEWTPIYRAAWGEHADAVLQVLRADGFRAEILACPDGDPPREYWSRQSWPKVWIGVPAEQVQRARGLLTAWEAQREARVASAGRALRRLVLLGGTIVVVCYFAVSAAAKHGYPLLALGLTLALIAFCAGSLIRAHYRVRRIPRGLCPRCQYDLRGNLTGRCPECGKRIKGRRRAATRRPAPKRKPTQHGPAPEEVP